MLSFATFAANSTHMIILDKPYVSELIKETIKKNEFEVLKTKTLGEFNLDKDINLIDEERAAIEYQAKIHPKIYTNSENAINWIATHLKNTYLPEKINLFKDKVKFRDLIKDMYPDFFYQEIAFDDLENTNVESFPFPFIIKPSVGFFSLGVYKVRTPADWSTTVNSIKAEIEDTKSMYPTEVMNATNFIAEEIIEGDEFAIDTYFNENGEPVIVGILKHLFSSDSDVSDRVYYTSDDVIKDNLERFNHFVQEVGKRAKVKNFPMHIEVRVTKEGKVIPIEINPMRFGGWCTSADLTTYAFNVNPYEYYFKGIKPNWEKALANKDGKKYCLVILDNTTGYQIKDIAKFDYDKVLGKVEKSIDLRKTDTNKYPVFGILYTETRTENYEEIEYLLKSDLKEFVTLK